MSRREFLRQVAAGVAAAAAAEAGWAAGGASAPSGRAGSGAQSAVQLPEGVRAVWDLGKAYQETTPTRARVCINGLWRWQPAKDLTDSVPTGAWGYFKAPGSWPGTTDYMQKDCQTVYPHPSWQDTALSDITAAWYQREITIPSEWSGRRIALHVDYLNSYAAVYLDGNKAGELRFPAGELDLTSVCHPGGRYLLSMFVLALPLRGVMLSYNDTASAREVRGSVDRRGLCGDVYLVSMPIAARISDVKVDTSVRNWEIAVEAGLQGLAAGARYALRAQVTENGSILKEFTSRPFSAADLQGERIAFTEKWKPDKLWDIHTPENTYQLTLSLLDADGKSADIAHPVRFGFREFWIEGRDFYLNGTRLFLSSVPLDNAGVGAMVSTYQAAREGLSRLKAIGINFVYGHNYGCEPGSHLSFAEILTAADDVGMLVALSQPHFGHYDWQAPDADQANGYARHADFYVRVGQNHPSVVAYSMSHNATGYSDDMNPDMIDGLQRPSNPWSDRNAARALRAEAIVKRLDPARIVYHHSSGNLSSMHTVNFYPNFVPAQELSDWLEHWATVGVKPFFTVEYAAPMTWDWTMYRGWYKGERTFGSAVVPWEFCQAEWSAQVLGDRSYQLIEAEKRNLRWEAQQFRQGKLWYRWDYPYQVGNKIFDDQHAIIGMYTTDNWRAYRTWGMSANSPWDHEFFWRLRDGVVRKRRDLPVDWENLQRPGYSPDYIGDQYERVDMAFELSDWEPTADAQALLRNNLPLLAYIAGKPARFTSKDHNFHAGETVEKQLVIINNSREPVTCTWEWSLNLPQPASGRGEVTVPTGQQERVPLRFVLPPDLAPGAYRLDAAFKFGAGEIQEDSFAIHVMPRPAAVQAKARIAVFDPAGEAAALLGQVGTRYQLVNASADLSPYDVLIIARKALTVDGPAPNLSRVRDGLKVIVFEQSSEALEKRLGFRVTEYGLRQVFARVAFHPVLRGLEEDNLRDWRGEATLTPPRLKYTTNDEVFNGAPVVKWCDIDVTRVWRCGNRGNVASVLIEKPARGDFLPLLDGGFGLQYSPLLEYREGKGMILFCQLDVTGRTEDEPAVAALVDRAIQRASTWKPGPSRQARYVGDPAGQHYFESAGVALGRYHGGALSADDVLIVGPGGGAQLARSAAPIASWLKSGGQILAIGLDEENANAFLPFHVSMTKAEHICAQFGPAGPGSLLEGVGCADTMSRDPRELPLLTGGASVVGNGVLALGENARVVFCQLVPWQFEYRSPDAPSAPAAETLKMNLKRTYRRTSFLMARLLANMGVAGSTPLLHRFGAPVAQASPDKRWLDGLYLDQPEEWDDPYRFFRW
jgi:hypothetical protein